MINKEFNKLIKEDAGYREDCSLCKESKLMVGQKTPYGAIIICKGSDQKNGWFATLSPKTGGNIKKDFTIQIMPIPHINHISELGSNEELAKNYGLAFSQAGKAITKIMREENRHLENEEKVVRIGMYGKSKHPEEHLHIKLFPWEHPYVVDSTYENKEIQVDEEENEFVKMTPVKKAIIDEKRFNYLAEKLINILK